MRKPIAFSMVHWFVARDPSVIAKGYVGVIFVARPPSGNGDRCCCTDLLMTMQTLGLQFLDGSTLAAVRGLNKPVRKALAAEDHILSLDKPRFIHGEGVKTIV